MELKGIVESIIYKNETNGYTISSFFVEEANVEDIKVQNAEMTIVGYLPFINEGDNLKVEGKFVTHPDYGEQFKVETFQKIMPQTLEALEKYLSNGVIKGIGPATAKKIVKEFGESTIEILRIEPDKLTKIKGITSEKAKEMSESFIENWELWQIVGFLKKFGIGPQSAQSIYKKLGNDTIGKIQMDPYILEDLGVKVDFAEIDKMAMAIGVEKGSLKRIDSGIIHGLKLATYNGHSCVIEDNLITYVSGLLGVSQEDVKNGIKDLKSKEKIIVEKRKKSDDGNTRKTETNININEIDKENLQKNNDQSEVWVYLFDYYNTEFNIATRILSLQESDNLKRISNIQKEIKNVSDIDLSEKQKEAIELINENNVSIITGGPGTGKTTIIKTIIDLYDARQKKTVLCAPTGRAAKRMTEATGKEAKTLHRLLEIGKFSDDEKPNPNLDVAPIDGDIIIIDEMSMVDIFLMNYLLKGIFKGTKLILVGDSDQLPSVGPGNVLKDLIDSNRIPYIALNKIFRQAAKSQIIVNAHKVNEGENFIGEIDDKGDLLDDFKFIPENNPNDAIQKIEELYDFETQIITPTKKGELGTKNLNKIIQEKYNSEDERKVEKKFGDVIFREGDKVMQTKNNYDIEWRRDGEYSTGVFNGEMGVIIEINDKAGEIAIKFDDDKVAIYGYQELEQLEHCFAITVHKSQGSEFSKVILPILQAPPMLLTRNVLYTGMTRAKDNLMIIGSERTVDFMINNINTKRRNSGLQYKLANMG